MHLLSETNLLCEALADGVQDLGVVHCVFSQMQNTQKSMSAITNHFKHQHNHPKLDAMNVDVFLKTTKSTYLFSKEIAFGEG